MFFSLSEASQVRLTVYNILGREVTRLVDAFLPAGEHTAEWDGTNSSGVGVASGIYFYRLETEAFAVTKKMLLLK